MKSKHLVLFLTLKYLQALLQDPLTACNIYLDDWQDVSVKRRSVVWQHFVYSKSREASRCCHCFKVLKNGGGSTKCLINHLTSKHKIEVPKQPKVEKFEHIKVERVESMAVPEYSENRIVENPENMTNVNVMDTVTVIDNIIPERE